VVAAVCGAAPAWRGASVDPQDALRGGRGGGLGRSQHRTLRTLVVFEIALSLVLLIGAGLVLKGFAGLLRNDPGFETAHVLTLRVAVPAASYANRPAVPAFLEPALDAVTALPQVESAGAISAPPYLNWGINGNIRYEGQPNDDPTRFPVVEQRSATPSYFGVTKQRLVSGRLLNASDDENPATPPVVVVNQALVKRDFRGENPVGRRFYTSDTSFATIVGVVSDVRNAGPIAEPAPEMYWSYRQSDLSAASFPLMIRVKGDDPTAVVGAVRAAIRKVDPQAAVSQERPMTEVIAKALGRPRFYFSLLGTFAAVALLLALAGLYGVLSYVVAQRTRELGIRTALGSSTVGLVALVTRDGLTLVGAGIVLGLAGGAAVTRLMAFMLYGVSPLDVATWSAAALLMLAAGALASLVPARRATRVDPTIAIRTE
jgi:predicted permease